MKGLLRKDFYMYWQQGKFLSALVLFYCLLGMTVGDEGMRLFWGAFTVLMVSMMPRSLMAYDERSKWEKMAICMPVSRKTFVYEKYLFAFLCGLSGVAVYVAGSILSGILRGRQFNIGYAGALLAFSLLDTAIELPILLKMGVEKGRLWLTAAMIVLFALAGGGSSLLAQRSVLENAGTLIPAVSGLLVVVVGAALFFFSLRISVRIYEKREFG